MAEEKKYLDKAGLANLVGKIKTELSKKANTEDVQPKGEYATLVDGTVPASQLPSYVDDVVEFSGIVMMALAKAMSTTKTSKDLMCRVVYVKANNVFVLYDGKDYYSNWGDANGWGTFIMGEITGATTTGGRQPETGKIYVDTTTEKTYRWSGSSLVEISASLALGETSETAFAGDRGVAVEKSLETVKTELSKKSNTEDVESLNNDVKANTALLEAKSVTSISTKMVGDVLNIVATKINGDEATSYVRPATTGTTGLMSAEDKNKLDNTIFEEGKRQIAEKSRVEAENSRVAAEQNRVKAENERDTNEDSRNSAEETREQGFTAKVGEVDTAIKNCNTATEGAEKVDVRLSGNVLTVIRRTGEEQSINLTDSDEHITVNCTTNVEGKSVEGLVLNVYINNGSNPHQYTTDSNGQTSFSVEKGATYRVVLPYIEGCATPDPIEHIAAVGSRIIDVKYVDEAEVYETLTIKVNKAGDDDVYSAWEGFTVHVTVGGETTDYTTDSNGKVELRFKIGTSYTINVDKIEGMWETMDRYSVTRTAVASSYRINLSFHTYESGIWLIDDEDKQYTYDEWDASGKSVDHLVFIRIATVETQKYSGDLLISIDKMSDFAKVSASKQWASQNVEFKNIPFNGSDKNYSNWGRFAYNGLLATQTIIAEGDERSIETPACDWCYNFEVESNGKTYKGYLPTLYQRKIFIANIDMIMEGLVMKYPDMGSGKSSFLTDWWTSTQGDANFAWHCGGSTTSSYSKTYDFTAFPFFACLSTSPSLLLSSGSEDASSNVVA